jgi:hypothetical protein
MDEFELRDIPAEPGRTFIGEIALSVENQRASLLPVDMRADNASPYQVLPVCLFIVRVCRDVQYPVATLFKSPAKAFIVRLPCKNHEASTPPECLGDLGMYFFCTTRMVEGKEKEYFIRFFQGVFIRMGSS